MPKVDVKTAVDVTKAIAVATYLEVVSEREPFVDKLGSMSDCCGRDVEYDFENEVWFCSLCGEPCGVM